MKQRNEQTLPKWARELLDDLRFAKARLERELDETRAAHQVLMGRNWLTIPGPASIEPPLAYRKLWYLNADQPIPACTLYHGDVLLVGRTIPETPDDNSL